MAEEQVKIREEIVSDGRRTVAIHDWSPVDEQGHHKSSEEIEHDINETRHSMDIILDTLAGRASPRSIMDRISNYFGRPENRDKAKDTLKTVGNRIANSFQRNPLPVLLATTGAVWMVWESGRKEVERIEIKQPREGPSGAEKAKGKAQEFFETAKEKVNEGKEMAKERFSGAKERASEKFEQGRERARQYQSEAGERGESYKERGAELRGQASQYYKENIGKADRAFHQNPLAFGAAALLGGLIAGFFLPETKGEKELVGEQAHETFEKARETGEGVLEKSKEVAGAAAGAAKGKAQEQGMTPEQIEPQQKEPSQEIGTKAASTAESALKSAEEKVDQKRKAA